MRAVLAALGSCCWPCCRCISLVLVYFAVLGWIWARQIAPDRQREQQIAARDHERAAAEALLTAQ